MRGIFSLDGAFYKWGSLIADILVLSLMWIFFSLPIVTIGASTTALFYVTTRRISEREGYITRDFWEAFKSNFKRATGIWLIHLLMLAVLYLNITNISLLGDMSQILLPLQIVILIEITIISFYVYPLTARFEMKWTQIIKTAFFMANRHIFTTFTCVALAAAIIFGILAYPLLLLAAMGLYAWMSSYMLMKVFRKYHPEMDKNPAVELQEIEHEIEERKRLEWANDGSEPDGNLPEQP